MPLLKKEVSARLVAWKAACPKLRPYARFSLAFYLVPAACSHPYVALFFTWLTSAPLPGSSLVIVCLSVRQGPLGVLKHRAGPTTGRSLRPVVGPDGSLTSHSGPGDADSAGLGSTLGRPLVCPGQGSWLFGLPRELLTPTYSPPLLPRRVVSIYFPGPSSGLQVLE
ncbi:unnamed protein product [Rangifer tarandus platyrhynchus]|uniref:Uncharacterized protein n=1 Tax=Rangifer tarandus platyrhynchus TaxID=3082113 RepID=A0AC59YKN6_RANTA